jgi:NADPH:quinone reductase
MPALPATITAVMIEGKGGPEVLVAREIACPVPGPGQVLVANRSAGVNRPDVQQRKGLYPAPKGHSPIPGLEIAGHVASVGPGVERFKVGDVVMALVNGGGYATHTIAEAGSCLAVPAGLDMVHAGGFSETFFTVWHNVFERGRLKAGDWILVHGGSSGIGVAAIQLAKAFGAKVIVTAGSAAKCQACLALGADHAIDYSIQDFVEAVREITGGHGADVILDMVGADYIDRDIKCAAEDGRIVSIAFQKGGQVTADLQRMMMKRLTLTGSTLRVRTNDVKAGFARALETYVVPLLAAGKVRIVMDSTFPLREAASAHARMDGGQHIGKIVLTV